MNFLERIRDLKEGGYTLDEVWDIADEIEEVLGADMLWSIVKRCFSIDDVLDILEEIAKEADI